MEVDNEKDVPWITTYTGKQVNLINIGEDEIDIVDIAHSLALTCRYMGHCNRFYSVAEHSVRLCDMVPSKMKPYALMHDAAEAYLGDMAFLPKRIMFPKFKEYENAIMGRIIRKYHINIDGDIKPYEYILLATEVRDLGINTKNWFLSEKPLDVKIRPWTWYTAKELFYYRFQKVIT